MPLRMRSPFPDLDPHSSESQILSSLVALGNPLMSTQHQQRDDTSSRTPRPCHPKNHHFQQEHVYSERMKKQELYDYINWSSKFLMEDKDDLAGYFGGFQTEVTPSFSSATCPRSNAIDYSGKAFTQQLYSFPT